MRSIAETMNIAPERLTAETSLADDPGPDSVAMVDVLMALKDALGVKLVDKYNQEIKTVGDIVGFIVAQLPGVNGLLKRQPGPALLSL